MGLGKTMCAVVAAAALVPGTALAHDGHQQLGHHHHRGVVLKGTVGSIDTSAGTLVVKVEKANRGGNALEGDEVTVKAVKGWVADTNNDGKRSLADVATGDTVLVFTKRRSVDAGANKVSAAFVVDKTHPGRAESTRDGGDCDHHDNT
jgi:hypothetical protein